MKQAELEQMAHSFDDLSDAEISRLHAPVGLPLGSKTPAEIAIAILAQLTALRAEAKSDIQADFRAVAAG